MAQRLKAVFAGMAAVAVSLLVTVPASVILAEYRSTPVGQVQSSSDELSFSTRVIEVSLVPAIVCAAAIFVLTFLWVQRRRETRP